MNFRLLCFLLIFQLSFSQGNNDTIAVDGGNWIAILQNASFYVDTTNSLSEKTILSKISSFKKNKNELISLEKQPYNLWVSLKCKNVNPNKLYWLSIYSQADTVVCYERKSRQNHFVLKKLSNYVEPALKRGDFKVRFHYFPFDLLQNETTEVLLLIKNRKHYTNFYADFTPPQNNLNWEKEFYWSIGSFVSVFLFIGILCFIFGISIKNRLFIYYSLYLFFVVLLILQEELLISVIENEFIYSLFYRLNSTFIMLIIMGLSVKIFLRLSNLKSFHHKISTWFKLLGIASIAFGLWATCLVLFFPNLNFDDTFYNFIWNTSIVLSVLNVFLCSIIVLIYFVHIKKVVIGIVFSVIIAFINPVIYYLNYSKIIDFYTISYPNYYYYVVLFETLALGTFIIFQFKKQLKKNINLLKDKIAVEENLRLEKEKFNKTLNQITVETQQELLTNLSNDLHDDLGQKLSVINFSLENLKLKFQSEEINQLKQISVEVSNSIRNLSHWLKDFEFHNKTIFEIIKQDIQRIVNLQLIEIKVDEVEILQLSTSEKIIIFRVYQELLNNSLKYANASKIEIQFYENRILFSDNGVGFEAVSNDGLGLKIIQERLQLIQWNIEKTDNQHKGTTFRMYRK